VSTNPARNELVDAFVPDFLRRVHAALDEIDLDAVSAIVSLLVSALRDDRHVYVLGNGGSASTASHLASDLHAAARGGRRLRVTSLCDNVAVLTATANDHGWHDVFVDQLEGRIDEGDVVIALSASGESENVLRALDFAREASAASVAFLGFGGGAARERADYSVVLSSRDFGVVESVHASLAHLVAAFFRRHVAV
jgi:D-sedoheptulose 7-phosphate isomerase